MGNRAVICLKDNNQETEVDDNDLGEVQDGWCKWVLLNGFTGVKDYTDLELDTKLLGGA